MDICEDYRYGESETDAEYSDDSQDDPTFDVLEETRLTFSNLSFKRKIKTHVVKGHAGKENEESDGVEMVVPELNEKEQKSYETIQKIVEVGPVERLKVEECKIYLRKHGLRLSGNKETLILRIKEHIDIVNGDGEKKYPASSFVLNCKGDACMGDIVMFEQNVFNIASRSANGPPCGTRVVAGRIVKESYGAAKQQHTFTIEVLWSKGEKPLPPLHPLLIKGRNLYRLKTMRQKWEDEGERQKILSEKHARGGVARLTREARIQQKEMRQMHKPTRAARNEHPNKKQEERREPLKTFEVNTPIQQENLHGNPTYGTSNAHMLPEGLHQMQSQISMNCSFQRHHQHRDCRGSYEGQHMNYHAARSPTRGDSGSYLSNSNHIRNLLQQTHAFKENQSPWHGLAHNSMQRISNMNLNFPSHPQQTHACHRQHLNRPVEAQGWEQKQRCRYYVQGRCYFGERCKYVHESAGNKV
ncbi:zinc finger CCCH domain-containing protein 62-like isoform X2 [Sesamum indicum]|uniref:Zinc finger CCCH domain-containing protein 62-like isoform X2 n=1 Tax=Sesamum indicum TaxID=4182 RepID=A0A8M8UNZ6_SESIN|nr:zinc finger CCCH domain-containing protein 62-like isoform X2 [Sesamum indicum]